MQQIQKIPKSNSDLISVRKTGNSLEPFIHKVVLLKHTETLTVAARTMSERGVGSVLVTDGKGHLVGILTDRDLVTNAMAFKTPLDIPLSDIMTEDVFTLDIESDLKEAVQVMIECGIRRLPIVETLKGGKQKCRGLITLDDLIVAGLITTQQMASLIRSQVLHRVKHTDDYFKKEDRKEHNLNFFFNRLIEGSGLTKLESVAAAKMILSHIFQKLPYGVAARWIARLPSLLQEEFWDLPAGPNPRLTTKALTSSLQDQFGLTLVESKSLIRLVSLGLEQFFKCEVLDIISNLPRDLGILLAGPRRILDAGYSL